MTKKTPKKQDSGLQEKPKKKSGGKTLTALI